MTFQRSTFSLIGERYLDTQFTLQEIEAIELELAVRGITGIKRFLLEYLAASGLWWNLIWWEWIDLNGRDICIGWLYNLVIGAITTAIIWLRFGWQFALVAALILHCTTLYLGFSFRAGTTNTKQDS